MVIKHYQKGHRQNIRPPDYRWVLTIVGWPKSEKWLLRRHAAEVKSCLEKIDCERSSGEFMIWQSKIGEADANNYLCSDDARDGELSVAGPYRGRHFIDTSV